MFILSWVHKKQRATQIVCIYSGPIYVYNFKFVFILRQFMFIFVGLSIYLLFLLFILDESLDHSTFESRIHICPRQFLFIISKFVFIIHNFCLLQKVCVYSGVLYIYSLLLLFILFSCYLFSQDLLFIVDNFCLFYDSSYLSSQ